MLDALQIIGAVLIALGIGYIVGGAIWTERPRPTDDRFDEFDVPDWVNHGR